MSRVFTRSVTLSSTLQLFDPQDDGDRSAWDGAQFGDDEGDEIGRRDVVVDVEDRQFIRFFPVGRQRGTGEDERRRVAEFVGDDGVGLHALAELVSLAADDDRLVGGLGDEGDLGRADARHDAAVGEQGGGAEEDFRDAVDDVRDEVDVDVGERNAGAGQTPQQLQSFALRATVHHDHAEIHAARFSLFRK